ncbi:hypothetical protein QR97_03660 [Streptomyces sp. PBH53]|nr:hypothetical protein QR97_03660 [Streptomyces sp. PBH53]
MLMPAELIHGVCQIRGLDAPAACVPQSAFIDTGERPSRRGPLPDHVGTSAAERSQGGHGCFVVADQQPFE